MRTALILASALGLGLATAAGAQSTGTTGAPGAHGSHGATDMTAPPGSRANDPAMGTTESMNNRDRTARDQQADGRRSTDRTIPARDRTNDEPSITGNPVDGGQTPTEGNAGTPPTR